MLYRLNVIKQLVTFLIERIKEQLAKQGHKATGELERSLEAKIVEVGKNVEIQIFGNSYAGILENGVKPSRVPYNPNSRSGAKTSQYIQALQKYMAFRTGKSLKESLGLAFAVARKHAKEGMSTRASSRFSSTGKRNNVIDNMISEQGNEIEQLVERLLTQEVEFIFENILKQ
jgi:hypothetical protein